MILLTRLNHQPIVVNAELIEYLDSTPDTVISLVHGQKLTVLEEMGEVVARVIEYKRQIHQGPKVHGEEPEVAGKTEV